MIEQTPITLADPWLVRVTEITRDEWGKQGWRFPILDQAGEVRQGIEDVRASGINRLVARRYSDFGDRMRGLANLIVAKAPLLAAAGSVTQVEYQQHLLVAMHRLVPFLNEEVREALAVRLIAEHARQ